MPADVPEVPQLMSLGPDVEESLEQSLDDQAVFEDKVKNKKGKMTTDENEEEVSAGFLASVSFFAKYFGPWWFIISQCGMALFITFRLANDYTMGHWAYKPEDQHSKFWFYGPICIGLCFCISLSVLIRGLSN